MQNHYIITKTKTECLLLFAASYSIHSKREELTKLKNHLEKGMPSKEELHRRFEINRRWRMYKTQLVKDIVRKRAVPNNTTYDDVPITLKIAPGVPWNLMG